MNVLDFTVLFGTLLTIVAYGIYKTRKQQSMESYLLGDKSMTWGTIGLSVMATQASAVTFISTPGQGYESGMGFVQNYFGLPFALIIISVVFIPIYYRLKVYTAYEYLEGRFDLKVRLLGAFLFLIQRGLAAGITIYAPAIVLSSIFHWNLNLTILITGLLGMVYTVTGGTKAVSITQKQQMAVIMGGMVIAFGYLIYYISQYLSFDEAVAVADSMEKMNAIDWDFSLEKRYTVWSGIAGGLFLALSYFGTDQSQVQRYLGGKNVKESRMGLMFNAVFKIPMQFFILFIGVMVYVFYLLYQPPVYFKQETVDQILASEYAGEYRELEKEYTSITEERKALTLELAKASEDEKPTLTARMKKTEVASSGIRDQVKAIIVKMDNEIKTPDTDYVFLSFVLNYLPHGLIGLLIAVILAAATSSTSSEVNALSSTTLIDFYKRLWKKEATDAHYVWMSKLLTVFWGILALSFAMLANNSENLIQAVNIVGSIFYGNILGIFLVAFFVKFVKGTAVFYAAIISQIGVIILHFLSTFGMVQIGYLWYNAIGLGVTMLLSMIFQGVIGKGNQK